MYTFRKAFVFDLMKHNYLNRLYMNPKSTEKPANPKIIRSVTSYFSINGSSLKLKKSDIIPYTYFARTLVTQNATARLPMLRFGLNDVS